MKKFILPCALSLLAVSAGAEGMKFVTLLSQPVGSVARVELLDGEKPAKIYNLNFCNTDSLGGTIRVTGTGTDYPVNATYFLSERASTLSSREDQGAPLKTYRVVSGGTELSASGWDPATIYLVSGADLVGGRLNATNEVKFTNSTNFRRGLLVAEEARGNTPFWLNGTLQAKVGSFYKMSISGGTVALFDTPATGDTLCSSLGWQSVSSKVDDGDSYQDSNASAKVLMGCTKEDKAGDGYDDGTTSGTASELKWLPFGEWKIDTVPSSLCTSTEPDLSTPCTVGEERTAIRVSGTVYGSTDCTRMIITYRCQYSS